jgi:hypothetical protein
MYTFKQFITENYKGQHEAPDKETGAPLHDVTSNGIYPKDVYSHKGFEYYGNQGNDYDQSNFNKIQRMKDKPDEKIYIFRAVPLSVRKEAMKKEIPIRHMIRPGDWVTTSKEYAHEHGRNHLNGEYHVAAMRVPAKHIFTDGNSHLEWGYDPK